MGRNWRFKESLLNVSHKLANEITNCFGCINYMRCTLIILIAFNSYGMFLWELIYQKRPYQNLKDKDICGHVVSHKRRNKNLTRNFEIQLELITVIKEGKLIIINQKTLTCNSHESGSFFLFHGELLT